ncbi:MAG: hypothetical protein M1823_008678, partial [Watsoniomyces obsoletus]
MPPPPPPKDNDPAARYYDDSDKLVVHSPSHPSQYRYESDLIAITSQDEQPRTMPTHQMAPPPTRIEPPPLPPKTPLPEHQASRRYNPPAPPYPLEDDDMPPPVNMA